MNERERRKRNLIVGMILCLLFIGLFTITTLGFVLGYEASPSLKKIVAWITTAIAGAVGISLIGATLIDAIKKIIRKSTAMMPRHDIEISNTRPLNNAILGVLILLGAETMLFVGLIGAFLVFRMGSVPWPPLTHAGITLPRLVTGINTLFLIVSGITAFQALRAVQQDRREQLRVWLLFTEALGLLFLIIQGREWIQLIQKGLTLKSGVYGGIFYILIGCHALHVLGAVIWLTIVVSKAISGRYSSNSYTGVQTCTIYWVFVVALWPILYVLVYLT